MSISYILHSAILLGGIYILYRVLLYKETFFKLNRGLLLFGILISFSLPLVPTPSKVQVAGISIESKTPTQLSFRELVIVNPDQSTEVREPLQKLEVVASPLQQPVKKRSESLAKDDLIFYVYLFGVLILLLNFLFQVFSLVLKIRKHRSKDSRIIELPKLESPCSFFGYTFISADISDEEQRRQILLHEQVHNDQYHSIDILLGELLCIVQWFNPFSWITRKAIERNLEFLVDQKLIEGPIHKKSYQYNLMSLSISDSPLAITTKFNYSLLKSRISMMNAKRSSITKSWKFLLFIPCLVFSMLLLNPKWMKAIESISLNGKNEEERFAIVLPPNSTKENVDRILGDVKMKLPSRFNLKTYWHDDGQLKSISPFRGRQVDYPDTMLYRFHDLNRHNAMVFEIRQDGYSGSGANSSSENDYRNLFEERELLDSNYLIYDASMDSEMRLAEYLKYKKENYDAFQFKKEKRWNNLFQIDIKTEVSAPKYFTYYLDDVMVDFSFYRDEIQHKLVYNYEVFDDTGSNAKVKVYTLPKYGYESQGGWRSVSYLDGIDIEQEKLKSDSLAKAYGVKNIKYLLDGEESSLRFETLDLRTIGQVYYSKGIYYGPDGSLREKQVRVEFSSKSPSEMDGPQYAIIIPGNSTTENLKRIQNEVEDLGHELDYKGLIWDDQKRLQSLDIEHLSSSRGTVHRVFNDINRFKSSIFFYHPRIHGNQVSNSFKEAILPMLSSREGFNSDEFIIMDASMNESLNLREYSKRIADVSVLSTFEKEKNWADKLSSDNDIANLADRYFSYSVNGIKVGREKFNEAMKDQEMLSLDILESADSKPQVVLKTEAKKGFYLIVQGMGTVSRNREEVIEVKNELASYLMENSTYKQIDTTRNFTFEIDGVPTNYTFDSVPLDSVSQYTMKYGPLYNGDGVKLRTEFRVNFISWEKEFSKVK